MDSRHFTVPRRRAPAATGGAAFRGGFAALCCALLLAAFPLAAAQRERAGDPFEATLQGEFALSAGRLDEGVDWYLQAARAASGDAGLAERATQLALLAGSDDEAREALELWRERAPLSPGMRAAEAVLALRAGKVRLARRELRALLAEPGGNNWAFVRYALAEGSKDMAVSARVLGGLVDDDAIPARVDIWVDAGQLAQHLGDKALAERIAQRVLASFPDDPRVALLRASQLRDAGRDAEAAAALARVAALPAAAFDPMLRLSLAAEYDALGNPVAAAEAMARGPQDERSQELRAMLLAKAEDKDGLAALYEELKRGAGDPEPAQRLLLGQVAEYLERPAEALDWYRGVPGGEQRWTARLRAAKVLHDLDRGEEAFAALRDLQQDASAGDETRRDAYLLEAELHRENEDPEGERDAHARGLAAFPDDGGLLYSRALMWERRDDIARAEADLRRILVAEPENVAALNALGYTLADRTTRYAEALELIDRARLAEPGNAAIIDSYGWVLYRLGRGEEALVELRRAYALQKDAEIAAHIGEVLWELGRKVEARGYFEEARGLDPGNRSLLRALEETGA